jgi:hypothetical protein
MIRTTANPLLEHVSNVSLAQDRLWAQIVGMAPSGKPWERLFFVLTFQTFIDDSYQKDGAFVLAGYIATAQTWAGFVKEWETLLPAFGVRKANGKYHFKMSKMQSRVDRILPFYRVIERHIRISVAFEMRLDDLKRARKRILIEGDKLVWQLNPFKFAFRELLRHFYLMRLGEHKDKIERLLPLDSSVDFYFDKERSAKAILGAWQEFADTRPDNIRQFYHTMPRFEDDEVFLPLQAADFWAWWVRKGAEDGTLPKIANGDFGLWKGKTNILALIIRASEDQLVAAIITALQSQYGHRWLIRDRNNA